MMNVAVLVDLFYSPGAGGHVKCWERLAEAATDDAFSDLDLTVHFLGDRPGIHRLSDRVRYRFHRPVLSTGILPFSRAMPDRTDLWPFSAGVARTLDGVDLIHTTGAEFRLARTGLAVAKRRTIPLTLSVHTDTAAYARIFSARAIEGIVGRRSLLGRFLLDRIDIPARQEAAMTERLRRYAVAADHAMVPRPDRSGLDDLPTRLSVMRRGIDTGRFGRYGRDRDWLRGVFGIPPDRFAAVYAGRVNRGKNIDTLIDAAERAVTGGADLHLVLLGEGEDRRTALARLGDRVCCPGQVPQETVARTLAAADAMVFPSTVEVFPNVVLEGIASGLPVLMAAEIDLGPSIDLGEAAVAIPGTDPIAWADALSRLATDAADRCRRTDAARSAAERLPRWTDVLRDDLVAHWRRCIESPPR